MKMVTVTRKFFFLPENLKYYIISGLPLTSLKTSRVKQTMNATSQGNKISILINWLINWFLLIIFNTWEIEIEIFFQQVDFQQNNWIKVH